MHPLAAHEHLNEIGLFRDLIATARFVGEVGLDFSSHGRSMADQQVASFDEVIRCAAAPFRIVTLHSRGAENEVLRCLEYHHAGPAIFHWYGGPRSTLEKIFSAGHYISLNPAMIRTQRWQKWASALPPERVLTETDGPYAKIGRTPAQPSDVASVVDWLGTSWSRSPADTEQIVQANFDRLLARLRT
jgi:TatD DNase family protein